MRQITGLAIAAALFVFIVLGLVMQRETDFVSFGDLRDVWNDYVEEHYAPTLSACVSRARQLDKVLRFQMHVGPSRELTVPSIPMQPSKKCRPKRNLTAQRAGMQSWARPSHA